MVKLTNALRTFDLSGRIAVVTGAGGHLGTAIAGSIADLGATVYLVGRSEVGLGDLCDRLRACGGTAEVACLDVTDATAVGAMLAGIRKTHGRLDVLVNNAHSPRSGGVDTASARDFRECYEIAVVAAFGLIQQSRALLTAAARAAGTASVINIASMYASVSPDPRNYGSLPPNPPSYGPAKAGLVQLTRYLACHLAADAIRVNAISPGPFPSDSVAASTPGFIDVLASRTPLGRIGRPEDLVGAVAFLAGDASRYVTGINLPVDGGWTAW